MVGNTEKHRIIQRGNTSGTVSHFRDFAVRYRSAANVELTSASQSAPLFATTLARFKRGPLFALRKEMSATQRHLV